MDENFARNVESLEYVDSVLDELVHHLFRMFRRRRKSQFFLALRHRRIINCLHIMPLLEQQSVRYLTAQNRISNLKINPF